MALTKEFELLEVDSPEYKAARFDLKLTVRAYFRAKDACRKIKTEIKSSMRAEVLRNEFKITDEYVDFSDAIVKRFEDVCDSYYRLLKAKIRVFPEWYYWMRVDKIRPEYAAVIITEIDVNRMTTASKLVQFAGISPGLVKGRIKRKNGKIVRSSKNLIKGDEKTAGFMIPYNAYFKKHIVSGLGESLIDKHGKYWEFFKTETKKMRREKKKCPKHIRLTARRMMVEKFLREEVYVKMRILHNKRVITRGEKQS